MSYTAKVIAVLGRTLRAGRWKLADESLVIALFGRCVLDLSRAYVDEEDEELEMSIFCLFGSVSVVLPPGCDVEPSGIAFLASSEVEIPSDKAEDLTHEVLAPLDISWFAMFGRVRINEISPDVVAPEPTSGLGPPDVAVFGAPQDLRVGSGAPVGSLEAQHDGSDLSPVPGPAAVAEPAEDEVALREEIAQWRSETGRPAPEAQPDPGSEIEPEEARVPDGEGGDEPATDEPEDEATA